MKHLLPLLLLAACSWAEGYPEPSVTTRGDVATLFSEAWCSYGITCGRVHPSEYTECVGHTVYHMCAIDRDCYLEWEHSLENMHACNSSLLAIDGTEPALCYVTPIECTPFIEEWNL